MLPEPVLAYLEAQGWGGAIRLQAVDGGCINNGHVVDCAHGPRLFLKTNPNPPPDLFAREADGLRALHQPGAPRVPRPLLAGPDFLLLEYLAPAPPAAAAWETFGRRLAALHAPAGPHFGFAHTNYLGSTPQPNPPTADGFDFFAEQRLLYQGRLARERGHLSGASLRALERLAARLRDRVPAQPPSLIHGDLWSGNVIPGPDGDLSLIDPAAHYGWAEAELAMTALFGGFPEAFYRAYAAAAEAGGRPLAQGFRQRFGVYNLYHLLNHLNLFGGHYLGQVEAVLAANR